MKCLLCGKRCPKRLKFCCKAHRRLYRNPPKKTVPCHGCGHPQRRSPSQISKSGIVYCKRCRRAKGEDHYKFNEGQYIDRAGYRMVLINGKYIREHRLEWERANKASLLERGSIHHIRIDLPFNKTYNEPDNLLLLSDENHGRFHRLYDAGRVIEALQILKHEGLKQLHYPAEIDKWYLAVTNTEDDR